MKSLQELAAIRDRMKQTVNTIAIRDKLFLFISILLLRSSVLNCFSLHRDMKYWLLETHLYLVYKYTPYSENLSSIFTILRCRKATYFIITIVIKF